MNHSWQYWPFITSLYALGVLGFFAITLLPLRSWLLLRRNSHLLSASTFGKVSYALILLAAILAIGVSGFILFKVSKCLLGLHCSANRSGGWFFLASIGFWYMAFEVLSFTILRAARRFSRVAT